MTTTVNRADLAWAISAVLPHAGTKERGMDQIGIHGEGQDLYVYALDGYSAGIARVPVLSGGFDGGPDVSMPTGTRGGEAGDLEKLVRIRLKGDKDDGVLLLPRRIHYGYPTLAGTNYDDIELHVGIVDSQGDSRDSAVFNARPDALQLADFWPVILSTVASFRETLEVETREYTFNPKLLSRFDKAQRYGNDRLRMYPYAASTRPMTYAVVTVGHDFLGAIAGMTQEDGISPVLESFDQVLAAA